jgi:predicted nucleic acid-binding protein
MSIKKLSTVICNSSPIIGLSGIGKLDLLWTIFQEVLIPEAVYNEVVKSQRNKRVGTEELHDAIKKEFIKIYHVKDELFVNRFMGKLHRGELEVIAGAKELDLDYLLIDEKSARSLAEALMLEPTGLLGILKFAKLSGAIEELKPYLDGLIENNYRICKKLYNGILLDVGEI